VFDAEDPEIMYYSGDQHLARSMDGGETWEQFYDINPNQKSCWTVTPASHPASPAVVYAAIGVCMDVPVLPGDGGIFLSNNYGQNWISKTNGMTDTYVHSLAIHPNDPDKMLAGTDAGLGFCVYARTG
jgi:hypothetical protein